MKKNLLIILSLIVMTCSSYGQTRNYILFINNMTNTLIVEDGLMGLSLVWVRPGDSYKFENISKDAGRFTVNYLDSSGNEQWIFNVSSADCSYVETVYKYFGDYYCIEYPLDNLDLAGHSALSLNAADFSMLGQCFWQGLIYGSMLAAVLLGFRYTKKALGWVDGGGE